MMMLPRMEGAGSEKEPARQQDDMIQALNQLTFANNDM